jgi:hypothetical protein
MGPVIQIGTLTIDQSGTGRLQQIVEGVSVQDVVGQAIVIYTATGNQPNTLPPNLNPTVDAAGGTGATQTPAVGSNRRTPLAGTAPGRTPAATQRDNSRTLPANVGTNGIGNNIGGNLPIAGGVIRLMADGVPDATGAETADQTTPSPQSPTGAESVPQNSAIPAPAGAPTVR